MNCPHCAEHPEMYMEYDERPLEFFVFGLVMIGIGAALHLFDKTAYAWMLYGIGGFIWFQGAIKLPYRRLICKKCFRQKALWPWTK